MSPARLGIACVIAFTMAQAGCSCIPENPRETQSAPAVTTGLLFKSIVVGGVERRYAVLVPRGYDATSAFPLIVFLNGRGECGTDGQRQTMVGLGPAAMLAPEKWPFIVVFPQKPDQDSAWIDHDELVLATLNAARRDYRVDEARVYLTGLSQGGAGTWAIGSRHADAFAAIAPVCGYAPSPNIDAIARGLRSMPVWAFHGEKDEVVKPRETRSLVAALAGMGGRPEATYFPEANHNSWDAAYRESDLGAWFLKHARR